MLTLEILTQSTNKNKHLSIIHIRYIDFSVNPFNLLMFYSSKSIYDSGGDAQEYILICPKLNESKRFLLPLSFLFSSTLGLIIFMQESKFRLACFPE